MNRVCTLPILFLLGSLTAIAQTAPGRPAGPSAKDLPAPMVLQQMPSPANQCPAGIQVKEQGIPRLVYVKSAPVEGPAVGLRITVNDSRLVGITSVRVAVLGYTQGRLMSGSADSGVDSGEVGKSFRVVLKVAPGGVASTEVWAKGFVSISSVDLTGVIYADGSTWRAANHNRCRIAPNLRLASIDR